MIRKLRKTDLDEVAYIWLHTNKKAHDFIAETYWDEHFEMVEGMLGDAEIYVFEEQGSNQRICRLGWRVYCGNLCKRERTVFGNWKTAFGFRKKSERTIEVECLSKK